MAAAGACWPSSTTTDITDLVWSALQAVSAIATPPPPTASPAEVATHLTLAELAIELSAVLWSLGTRPELICLTCSLPYHLTGLLRCPRCRCR